MVGDIAEIIVSCIVILINSMIQGMGFGIGLWLVIKALN